MLLPGTQGAALGLALVSTICWGSWGIFLVFVVGDKQADGTYPRGKMPFELFYLAYSGAAFLVAVLAALTIGMVKCSGIRGSDTFADDFSGIGFGRYACAFSAGLVFNVANLLLCKGVAMLGLALAFPLCIGTSMVLGTALTYAIAPSGSATLLFLGVFVAFCAVCTAALMHRLKEKQQRVTKGVAAACSEDVVEGGGPSMARKLVVCLTGGVLMGLWNPLLTLAEAEPGLSPFGEFTLFTLGVLLSSLALVPLIIVLPIEGGRGEAVRSVLSEYRRVHAKCHIYSFVGGAVWATGTLANAMAGASSEGLSSAEGYAIGQCANVAAIFWGIFLFREFRGTDWKVTGLVILVLFLYIGAIALVTAASE